MNSEFRKIKRRFLTEAIIKSAVCGVSAGLAAVGAVLLGLKLADTEINAGFYVLIALGAAGLVGGGLFLLLRPTDKKIAEKLDREHGLNEKVQTMVAFGDREEDIYELQRKDANEKLAALPKYKPDFKKLWQYAVITVLSLALFIASVAVPKKAPPPEPEPPFEYTERQKAAVEALIADVGATSLSDGEKTSVTATLNTMSENLETTDTQANMRAIVLSAVSLVDVLLYTPNSFDNVAYALGGEKTEFLAAAVNDGALFYAASAVGVTTLDQVKSLESGLDNSIGDAVDMDLTVFVQQYDGEVNADVKEALDEINEIMKIVSNDVVAAADDAVRVSVEHLREAMEALAENYDTYGAEEFKKAASDNIGDFADELVPALKPQSYRCIVDDFVRRRVAQIFNINANDLPRQTTGVQEIDQRPDDGDDDGNNSGGAGKGDTVFGSSEIIYDPDTGELTAYGKVFNRYYAAMMEQLENMPENLQESVKAYFDVLYSGTIPKSEDDKKEE